MEKTVICIATPLYAPQIGGPATHVALLEEGLSKSAFLLRVVKFSAVQQLPKIVRHSVYFFTVFKAAWGAEFVYALDPVSVGLPALCAAKLLGKKFVLRVGGDYAWEQGTQRFGVTETLDEFVIKKQPSFSVRWLQRVQSFVARRAVVVIAPSKYLGGIIQTWGVLPQKIQVIYSQPDVSTAYISRSDARKKLGLKEDEELVLSAGRLVPWKGYEGLVDAVARVQTQRRVRLVIVGSGPHGEALQTHIEKTHAQSFATLRGQLSHADLYTWLVAADLFVLNTMYEGLSHVVLEAFAARTPVITTPVGGNTELVEDGKTGLLVLPNDVQALSAAIIHLLTDRAFAAKLAEAAHASRVRFNSDIALQSLHSLFETI
ncbi:MAG: glycosyltransferase family 4 protein [Candidatus Adlerbacteria bacterium]|nr:glycosyltransferase family 4 protein [Candidatus Adlerbacteria bacterium]